MPKVSVKLGLTLPGPEQYSSFRADFGISEIDTDADVDKQLEAALEAGDKATVQAEAGLAQQATNLSGISLEGVGLGQQFAEFRERFSPLWKQLVERVKALEGGGVYTPDDVVVDDEKKLTKRKVTKKGTTKK